MSNGGTDSDSDDSGINITLGKIVAYPIGGLLILAGLGAMTTNVVGGILILLAGVIALPLVRSKLKQSQGVAISRWATLGLVLILVIAGGVMMSGGEELGAENNGSQEDSGPEELTHQMGESFTVGEDDASIEYTVQNAYTTNTIFGFEAEETDEQFVILEIEMENVGDETVDITTRHLQLVDSQERQFDVDTERTLALDQDGRIQTESIAFEQLQPGISTQGAVAFEVPAGETELRFKIEPVGVFSTADEHFVELELEELEE